MNAQQKLCKAPVTRGINLWVKFNSCLAVLIHCLADSCCCESSLGEFSQGGAECDTVIDFMLMRTCSLLAAFPAG